MVINIAGTTIKEGLGYEEEILEAMVGTHLIAMALGAVEVVLETREALLKVQGLEDLPGMATVTGNLIILST